MIAAASVTHAVLPWLLLVGFLGFAVLSGVLWWRRQQAASEIREWALRRGFRVWSTRGDLAVRYAHGPFGHGRGRVCLNVVEGEYGTVPFRLFTYQFTTGSGKDKQTVYHRVAAARLDLWVPTVELRSENAATRLWGAVRGDDLDLESHAFNQAYRVETEDRRTAVSLLPPATMEYLLAHRRQTWWFEQGDVLFADRGEWHAAELDRAVADVVGMARLVPRHVLREYGVQAEGGVR